MAYVEPASIKFLKGLGANAYGLVDPKGKAALDKATAKPAAKPVTTSYTDANGVITSTLPEETVSTANKDALTADAAKGTTLRSVEYGLLSNKPFSAIDDVKVQPRYDVIYPEVVLYVEGVQVPFESMSISYGYGATPEATISIPYYQGITEICKGYFPKVHVFFRDITFEKFLQNREIPYEEKHLRRLMFSGVMVGYSYSKTRSSGTDTIQVSFRCVHKYYVMQEIAVRMIGGGTDGLQADTNATGSTISRAHSFNTNAFFVTLMQGLKIPAEEGDKPVENPGRENTSGHERIPLAVGVVPNHVQKSLQEYQYRLAGIPGMIVSAWNSMRRDAYIQQNYTTMMTDLYIPLVEDGIRIFQRMTGHPTIETVVEKDRGDGTPEEIKKKVQIKGDDNFYDPEIKIMVPPIYANFVQKAASIDFGLASVSSYFQKQGDTADFIGLIASVLKYFKYDFEVLGAPVQVPDKDRQSIDVIVKPTMPQYYSPVCNVLLPYMHSSVTLNDFTYSVPTRMFSQGQAFNGQGTGASQQTFRAPEEVRIVTGINNPQGVHTLGGTMMVVGEFPTPTEMGRGVKFRADNLDSWISHLTLADVSTKEDEPADGTGTTAAPKPKATHNALLGKGVIDPASSDKEDMSDESKVWKYWDKSKEIPKYIADTSVSGYNMEQGKAGKLPSSDPTNTAITVFRTATKVPKFWNVIYFPTSQAFLVFPPHYDYMGEVFFITKELEKAIAKNGSNPYEKQYATPASPTSVAGLDSIKTVIDEAVGTEATPTPILVPVTASTSAYKSFEDVLLILRKEWNANHPGLEGMNPYEVSSKNGTQPYMTTIFQFMDYEYALAILDSRTGGVECPFNPYIIPGYPMDIIDASPEKPSIHAFCTSVTHSITGSSIGTSVSFVGASTYEELRAYRSPSIPPWFQYHLGMNSSLSIMEQSEDAKAKANEFYRKVLGVGFADVSLIEDPVTGTGVSLYVNDRGDLAAEGTNVYMSRSDVATVGQAFKDALNPNLTYEGNLALIRREIETQEDIERLSDVKFIDIQSKDSLISIDGKLEVSSRYREVKQDPGRSVFLEYTHEDAALARLAQGKATPSLTPKSTGTE